MLTRMIYTQFWEDDYVQLLEIEEKYLFLFLISNPRLNQIGVFQISKTMIKFYTGLELDKIENTLSKFEEDNRIMRQGEFIALLNAHRYSGFKGAKNASAKKSEWGRVPAQLKTKLAETQAPDYMAYVTAAGYETKEVVWEIDVAKFAKEFGLGEAHIKETFENFKNYYQARGTHMKNVDKGFKVWLSGDIGKGKIKVAGSKLTWDQMDAFKKKNLMHKLTSGEFTQDLELPAGTPDKWVNVFNEKWASRQPKETR